MAKLQPFPGMRPSIGTIQFGFVQHPLFANDADAVYVIEGGEALIYQVRNITKGGLFALKVMKSPYRSEHILHVAETLTRHPDIHGLYLPHRLCLVKTAYPELIALYPELEYAVLMPWLEGKTWAGLIADQTFGVRYTLRQACGLATAMAHLLWQLEARHMAHADIAGGNVFLSSDLQRVQLLDLEGMYVDGFPVPPLCSQGSPGYQHCNLGPCGQWDPLGDRFSGAILLTEMLTWWSPRVRARVSDYAESLFQPDELQVDGSPCWTEVRNTLWSIRPDLLYLFDQAWSSSNLAECPDFATWAELLLSFFR
jgi:hypothetical protein